MIDYKQPKLFGKDEDGFYLGKVEQIMTNPSISICGNTIIKGGLDTLCISNRCNNAWIFSLFSGYRQIGTYTSDKFKEGDLVIVEKKHGKIISVEKDVGDCK
jgi:hypothetical protein